MEILAPVGGREQLIAAVRSGADAVYLGTRGFNARQGAENFDAAGLREAVAYCHGRGVAVHVTVNTLVTDGERNALLRDMEAIAQAGADAVIIQDLAVAQLFRACCPDIRLHASTQLTVHNRAGAELAKELGFSRVVLARELTLEEIRAVADVGLETECFVHGALCMCVSGQCYLSSMLGGRSGNRGRCAQPCRLDFTGPTGRAYALSLKDMSHIGHIEELRRAGVCSLKIEGRMKRPEYVAAAVTACREALAGREPDMEKLRAVFSRSGFTDGYFTGKRDLTMFGHRTKEDVTAAGSVLGKMAELYRAERQSVPVEMRVVLKPASPAELTAADGTNAVTVTGAMPEPARTRPTDRETLEKHLGKTGGTPFFLQSLALENDSGLVLPPSAANALRRSALEQLLTVREVRRPLPFTPPEDTPLLPHRPLPGPDLRLRFETPEQIPGDTGEHTLILPLEAVDRDLLAEYPGRLWAELPAVVFPDREAHVCDRLAALRGLGLTDVTAGNLGTVKLALDLGLRVHGDFGLNILNTGALQEWARLGLTDATASFELDLKRILALGGDLPRGIVAYGYLPLMNFRACPARGERGCGACSGQTELTDRLGVRFPLLCRERRYATLLNSLPLHLGDRDLTGLDFITLYFTLEDRDTCRRVLRDYAEHRPAAEKRTRGLYFRELK